MAKSLLWKEGPQLECPGFGEDREPKRFKVRLHGVTYKEELKDKVDLVWHCRKNEGSEPMFTCDDQKIVKWDEKQ